MLVVGRYVYDANYVSKRTNSLSIRTGRVEALDSFHSLDSPSLSLVETFSLESRLLE
jgi:hypothetical protein